MPRRPRKAAVPVDVVIHRGPAGLDFTIKGGVEDLPIIVSSIVPGGVADVPGGLEVGDVIHEVNGKLLAGCSHSEAAKVLCSARAVVTLKIEHNKVFKRALQSTSIYDNGAFEASQSGSSSPHPSKKSTRESPDPSYVVVPASRGLTDLDNVKGAQEVRGYRKSSLRYSTSSLDMLGVKDVEEMVQSTNGVESDRVEALPAGWVVAKQAETGRIFYVNRSQQVTSWIHPGGRQTADLPYGWTKHVDAKTGRAVYSNHFTKMAQWKRPTERADKN